MKDKKVLTLTALAGLALAGTAQAATLVYESFDYSTGNINGVAASGTGLTGNWSVTGDDDSAVSSPGMTFTNLSEAGNTFQRNDRPGNSTASISLDATAQSGLTADNSTVYFSVLMDTQGSYNDYGDIRLIFGDAAYTRGSGSENGFGVGFVNDGFGSGQIDVGGIEVVSGAVNAPSSSITDVGQNAKFMFAGRIDWAASGSNDTMTLYNVTDPTAGPGTTFATMAQDFDQTGFDTLSISSQQLGTLDEIRFGESWTDVGVSPVPEPSSFALLAGCFGLTWIMLRRR
jgi:hypothetical protein